MQRAVCSGSGGSISMQASMTAGYAAPVHNCVMQFSEPSRGLHMQEQRAALQAFFAAFTATFQDWMPQGARTTRESSWRCKSCRTQ